MAFCYMDQGKLGLYEPLGSMTDYFTFLDDEWSSQVSSEIQW